jgi:hypothetical protein
MKRLDLLAAAAFVLGVAFLAFLAGFFDGKNQSFLYPELKAAEDTTRGLWNAYLDTPSYVAPGRPGTPARTQARVHDAARVAPGATFVVGYTPEGFRAWLVDAQGVKLHEWHARFSDVFPKPTHLLWQARDLVIAWHGTRLLPDGDIVFNFQDNNFPYGSGLVRLDKNSRVVWALARNTHHDVAVAEDGAFWVPSQRYRPEGLPGFPSLKPWYYEDTILKVSPEGEVLDEISVLEALRDFRGVLSVTYSQLRPIWANDPLHLNSVQPLPAAWAGRFPGLAAGDLLVLLRNVNLLAVIDPKTRKAKRFVTGPFVQQHDADFLPNGHLMVYDNRGGDPACGGTRVLEFDPATMATAWQYGACRDGGMSSNTRGMQAVLPNGNVLTVDAQHGRVLEVTHDPEPELVWEYHNVVGADGGGTPLVGMILHVERVPEAALAFLPTS